MTGDFDFDKVTKFAAPQDVNRPLQPKFSFAVLHEKYISSVLALCINVPFDGNLYTKMSS